VVVEQKTKETYHKGEDNNYSKVCEAQRNKSMKPTPGRCTNCLDCPILTWRILVDVKGQEAAAAALVRGAIGLDPSRGDTLEVVTVPVYQPHAVLPVIPVGQLRTV